MDKYSFSSSSNQEHFIITPSEIIIDYQNTVLFITFKKLEQKIIVKYTINVDAHECAHYVSEYIKTDINFLDNLKDIISKKLCNQGKFLLGLVYLKKQIFIF